MSGRIIFWKRPGSYLVKINNGAIRWNVNIYKSCTLHFCANSRRFWEVNVKKFRLLVLKLRSWSTTFSMTSCNGEHQNLCTYFFSAKIRQSWTTVTDTETDTETGNSLAIGQITDVLPNILCFHMLDHWKRKESTRNSINGAH